MNHEKSCGAVVFKRAGAQNLYLIEQMKAGHFSLPKGHVLSGETELETAQREIKEETNLDVLFLQGFRESIKYRVSENADKVVVFFMAEISGVGEAKPQLSEVSQILWLAYEEAVKVLTRDSDKDILRRAHEFYKNSGSEEAYH